MTRRTVTLSVNGRREEILVEPRRLLCDALRDDLGLTGTHVGCEHGVCGACTVLVDGRAERSCMTFAVQVDGAEHPHRGGPGVGDRRAVRRSSRRCGTTTACSAASARPAS